MRSSELSVLSCRLTSTCVNDLPSGPRRPMATRDAWVCSRTRSTMKPNSSFIGRSSRSSRARALSVASLVRSPVSVRSVSMSWMGMAIVVFAGVSATARKRSVLCSDVSKTSSVSPRRMRSPPRSGWSRSTRTPFRYVPFALPQSFRTQLPCACTISACLRER